LSIGSTKAEIDVKIQRDTAGKVNGEGDTFNEASASMLQKNAAEISFLTLLLLLLAWGYSRF